MKELCVHIATLIETMQANKFTGNFGNKFGAKKSIRLLCHFGENITFFFSNHF